MALAPGLLRRGGVYYFRARVPPRIAPLIGLGQVWRSLRTRDPTDARRQAAVLNGSVRRLWEAIARVLSSEDARALVDRWLEESLEEDLRVRMLPQTRAVDYAVVRSTEPWLPDVHVRDVSREELVAAAQGPDGVEGLHGPGERIITDANDWQRAKAGLRKPLETAIGLLDLGDTSIAEPTVRLMCEKLGVEVDPADPGFREAVELMLHAQAEMQRAYTRRDTAGWFWQPSDPKQDPAQELVGRLRPRPACPPAIVAQPASPATAQQPIAGPTPASVSAETLSTVVVDFLAAEQRMGQSANRLDEKRVAFDRFREWLGHDAAFASISPRQAGDFQDFLSRSLANGSKRPEYRDLSLADRVAEAARRGERKLLTPSTINGKYLDPLRSLYAWGDRNGRVSANPFMKVTASTVGSGRAPLRKRSFRPEQLQALLSHPVFVGAAGKEGKPLYRPGPVRIDDWRFWLPVMALYSGARLSEIGGLNVADFKEEDGVPFFHIRADTSLKSLKTRASERRVPVHVELVRLGLMRRVQRHRDQEIARLFPDLLPGAKNSLSDRSSKFFARLIDVAVSDDPSITFHSFRHTAVTALRIASVPRDIRKAIVGHEKGDGDVHDAYGDQPIQVLNEAIQAVHYRDLDLSSLARA